MCDCPGPEPDVASDFSSDAGLTTPRRRSLSVEMSMSGRQLACEEHIEDAEGCGLGERPRVSYRAHTARTAVLAFTLGDQLAGGFEKRVVHPEQRLAEPDAARIVV